MPERPKRRKNNKNKRKNNKNVRTESNKNSNNSSVTEQLNEACSSVSLDDSIQNNQNSEEFTECFKVKEQITESDQPIKKENETLFENKNVNHEEIVNNYVVEPPDQPTKNKTKLTNEMKSKSVDNDDSPTIIEITDEITIQTDADINQSFIDSNVGIISEIESDVHWQKVDDLIDISNSLNKELIDGASSSTTIPLDIAECYQTQLLSSEEEDSLRNYLKTLNLATNPKGLSASEINTEIEQVISREIKYRLRKKATGEDVFYQRAGPSRSLAVIDEEGSSESSMTSRRQSYLSDKKSDNDELEDEVFESKAKQIPIQKCDRNKKVNLSGHTIPQECIRVDAKLKEPEVCEARGNWTTKTMEKLTGAELVYLTDSSSSTSSIYDINDDTDNGEESDISVRIITPTIEVTDTEKLLKSNYLIQPELFSLEKETVNKDTKSELLEKGNTNDKEPPNFHEIVVESTENLKTNLFVKEITENKNEKNELLNKTEILADQIDMVKLPKDIDEYDIKIKVLKCELNDAFNNLISEVTSDSENTKVSPNELLLRQDSSSSIDSSQCTAKYNPTHSSLNDVSNIIHDNNDDNDTVSSHVRDVLDHVTKKKAQQDINTSSDISQPLSMRDLCLKRISLLPYGDKIIEELAQVSKRLQNLSAFAVDSCLNSQENKQLLSKDYESKHDEYSTKAVKENKCLSLTQNNIVPPPVKPRKSSLKKYQEDQKSPDKPTTESIYDCLSPSQKTFMEKTKTNINKDEHNLVNNISEKYVKDSKTETIIKENIKEANTSSLKSKTGSRLLSLICDTSLKNSVNSLLSKTVKQELSHTESLQDKYPSRFSNHELKIDHKSRDPVNKKNTTSVPSSIFRSLSPPRPRLFSSSFYESDSSSDFTEKAHNKIRNERKYFHFSTGNLNKDIEDDISCIQNMHRYYTSMRDDNLHEVSPRRPSLPKDICDQQMEYIRQKEQEVDAEIQRLELQNSVSMKKKGPRAPMIRDNENNVFSTFNSSNSKTSKEECLPSRIAKYKNSLFNNSEEELLREKMYSEYVEQMAERGFRKEQKVIKITRPTTVKSELFSKSMPMIDMLNSKVNNRIEREFITKARERWDKLGIRDPETEDEKRLCGDVYSEPKVIQHKIKVLEAGEEKEVTNLPRHLQEFVKFTVKEKDQATGDTGESEPEKQSAHVVVLCAVIILMMTVGKYFLRLLKNK